MARGAGIGHRVDDEDSPLDRRVRPLPRHGSCARTGSGTLAKVNVVDSSELVGDRVDVGAERHCRVSGRGSGDGLAIERVTRFDPGAMTIAYCEPGIADGGRGRGPGQVLTTEAVVEATASVDATFGFEWIEDTELRAPPARGRLFCARGETSRP